MLKRKLLTINNRKFCTLNHSEYHCAIHNHQFAVLAFCKLLVLRNHDFFLESKEYKLLQQILRKLCGFMANTFTYVETSVLFNLIINM